MVVEKHSPKRTILTQSLLLGVALVLLNLIANGLYFRLDFTQDKRYTLSQSTRTLLESLPEVITLHAYFSEDIPPELIAVRKDFQELLVEYENLSNGKFVYAFENPNAELKDEQKAQKAGISPVLVNVRKRDQVKQMRVYMGATLYAGDAKEVIPFLQGNRSAEHALTVAIKKLTLKKKPLIGVIQGHGEPTLEQLSKLEQQLSMLYEVAPISPLDEEPIPATYKALLWLAPTQPVTAEVLDKISRYLRQGGRLFLAYSPLVADLQASPLQIKPAEDLKIADWLKTIGIHLSTDAVLIDAQCSAITVAQKMGGFVFNTQVNFPYFPVVQDFSDHPISSDLESAYLQFASPLHYVPEDSLQSEFTVLFSSSPQTNQLPLPEYINPSKQWAAKDFTLGPQTLALALQGGARTHPDAKLVFVSGYNFLVPAQAGQAPPEANLLLTANAIDWLADDTGLINLRSKGISARPIKPLDDNTKAWISYANVLVPILLILLYALISSQYRLNKRNRWSR